MALLEKDAKELTERTDAEDRALLPGAEKPVHVFKPKEVDTRSIYVGQVEYSAQPDELADLFGDCGMVNRVTILCDRWTGHPKGFAYIEFSERDAVTSACSKYDGSSFKDRVLKVFPKRTNR